MRRFYAFLVMAISLICVVLFNVQAQYDKFGANAGLDFKGGTKITYVITPDEDNTSFSIENVADIFASRLEEAGAKDYYVDYSVDEGEHGAGLNDQQYEITIRCAGVLSRLTNILRSVETYGNIRLTTQDNETTENGEELIRGTAKVNYDGYNAYVLVDVTTEFESEIGKNLEASTTDENGEETASGDKIIVWTDYNEETDSYEEAIKNETLEQKKMQEKILAVLPSSAFIESKDGNTPQLRIDAIGYTAEGTSTQQLYSDSAHSFERLLNSEELGFEITRLYTSSISAEYNDSFLPYSPLLLVSVSALIAAIIISIVLIVKYGINGFAGAVSLLVSLFLIIVLFNFFGLSVSPAFLLSFIASCAMGLVIIVSYLHRFQDELYKGRTPAKANKDAFKKNLAISLDATVFTLITSIVVALISRNTLQDFFLFMIMSSVSNFLVCLFLTRLFLYFITNSKVAENKKIFRVKLEDIPDLSKEETQKFFSKHENFDSSKKQKRSLICLLGACVVSIAALLTFTFTSSTFQYTNDFDSYQVVQIVDYNGEDHFATINKVEDFYNKLEMSPFDVAIEIETDPNDENEEDKVYYVEAKFSSLTDEQKNTIIDTLSGEEFNFDYIQNEDRVYFFDVHPQVISSNFNNAMLLILLTAAFAIVYSIIRYRYTFTLSTLVTIVANVLITTGLLSLTRIPVSSNIGLALIAGVFISALVEFIVLVRYSQMIKERKQKSFEFEDRKVVITDSLKRSITPMFVIYGAVMLSLIAMSIVSPISMFSLFCITGLSLTIGLLLMLFIFVPVYLFSEKKLRLRRVVVSKKVSEKKQKKLEEKQKKKNLQHRRSSAEPEEVIIPGIND